MFRVEPPRCRRRIDFALVLPALCHAVIAAYGLYARPAIAR